MTTKSKLHAFIERIKLNPAPGSYSDNVQLSNEDPDPIPPEKRTWTALSFVFYWTSDQFAPATWYIFVSTVTLVRA